MDAFSDSEKPDDCTLMLRACAGDQQAFAAIVGRHQKSLLNFFHRCGVYNDAEDLVQQTFLRLYRYRDRYTANAKLTTFLYLLARQVWIDEVRRRTRVERLRDSLAAEPEALTQPASQPERGRMDLDAALDRLPEGLRLVVVMAIYQDMPYAEIATALGIPEGTVKSRMFNALRLLRRTIEETP